MILDAAETVLGYFGFDRTVYGNKKNTGTRKWQWLEELTGKRKRYQDRNDGWKIIINNGYLLILFLILSLSLSSSF
jgi:hypothetical protein